MTQPRSYRVHESFWSIQGEGVNAGDTAVFLRLQGCPVGCAWCDSKLTWYAGGKETSLDDITSLVRGYPPTTWIVITGGEPLIYDLDPLLSSLATAFPTAKVQIETSGAYPYLGRLRPAWTCLSPKYPVGYRVAENVLLAASELKYVVDDHFSPDVVASHECHPRDTESNPLPVVLMPEGCPPKDVFVRQTLALLRDHPQWRFGPRLQYDYTSIREGEGQNNQERQVQEAKARAHAHRVGAP